MQFLRTNTATRITVGPFLDKTDGVTPETALTVTSCKLTMMVDDGGVPTLVLDTNPTASGGANDMVHVTGDDAGYYDLELAAGNVNYLGRAKLALTDAATHCPVFMEFMILPAVVYDSFVLGTDVFQVDVTQWLGTAPATPAVAGVPEVDLTHVAGATTNVAALATNVDAILTDTAEIGTAGAGLTNINLPNQTMDIVGNITGNLSGSVGSVTGAVGSVTGAVGSVTGNVGGNVVGSVASVVGAVGSVVGAVGSVTGAVGSVTGNVGGNVVGSVASVTGNVGGNVVGSVASVTAKVTPIDIDGITFANMMKYIGATTQGKVVITLIAGTQYTYDAYSVDGLSIVWTATVDLGARAQPTRA